MEIIVNGLDGLSSAAEKIIAAAGASRIIALHGEMGAGKTTLAKAIFRSLGVDDVISSPTFSIVNEYKTGTGDKAYHFDFYRIKNISEAHDLGFEDYLYSGSYCLIEWPELVDELLPVDTFHLNINADGTTRRITG